LVNKSNKIVRGYEISIKEKQKSNTKPLLTDPLPQMMSNRLGYRLMGPLTESKKSDKIMYISTLMPTSDGRPVIAK
jgi:hypothetical protein